MVDIKNKVKLGFDEWFVVLKNRRGVYFLQNMESGEIVAKQCTECEGWYFLHGFNKAKKGFAGTHSLCRTCHNKHSKEYVPPLVTIPEVDSKAPVEVTLQDVVNAEMNLIAKEWKW